MRWKSKKPRYYDEHRHITKFLFFPKKVNHEWRWLERVTILQKVDRIYSTYTSNLCWVDVKWIDKKKKKKGL